MEKTLGGERLGNGKKIKVDLHGWGRSTFNQDRIWRSTMAPGVLVPCFQEIGLNGTTFDIDINTLGHTIPTIAPLFGSFKLQIDMFACPIRLYQGLLHNNAVNIGLDMSKVLLPKIQVGLNGSIPCKTNTSSLNNYLGIRGATEEKFTFNAIPHLAYYDIFKNYYSNKQEEMAKVISADVPDYIKLQNVSFGYQESRTQTLEHITTTDALGENLRRQYKGRNQNNLAPNYKDITYLATKQIDETDNIWNFPTQDEKIILQKNSSIKINASSISTISEVTLLWQDETTQSQIRASAYEQTLITEGKSGIYTFPDKRLVGKVYINENQIVINIDKTLTQNSAILTQILVRNEDNKLKIVDFPLKNIDDARRAILAKTDLNQRITLNEEGDINFLPYSANFMARETYEETMSGLVLKTYQNDIYNTWLSTEYVQLINEISAITPNEQGQITMDALILSKKVYNIMNRIAASGGTYEDWQEANFGENAIRRAESPIYIGGTSAEITFEEVVSTAQTENQPLATLGGKGIITNKKGGSIVYKCEEPCLIMGIASITPRVDYHQGNKWFMTELDNMDNFHKPGLDGIGFQNLIANNVVWTDSPEKALAKQPAWIQYQTAVNEVFGQFAEDGEYSLGHMVLRRNYETDENGEITDFTTYIDPSKYNYAFAENSLTAQNFWLQIGFNCKSRRKMASYEIPNL